MKDKGYRIRNDRQQRRDNGTEYLALASEPQEEGRGRERCSCCRFAVPCTLPHHRDGPWNSPWSFTPLQ